MNKVIEPQKRNTTLWVIAAVLIFIFIIIPLGIFMIFLISIADPAAEFAGGNVAVIKIRGIIMRDDATAFDEQVASSAEIIPFIEDADKDKNIKAIVIDINSPGGSAVASDEIAQALKRTTKPTVSIIHEVGASGGYWIASATDTIIANRMSITGSIGVIASYLEFSGLFDKYGIEYERMVAGKYKDMGTPFKNLSSEERTILQSKLDKLHAQFIQEIAANRKLSIDKVKKVATGEFYLGEEAQQLGLVDMLGDEQTLEDYLKQTLQTESIEFVFYESQPSFLSALARLTQENLFFMGKGIGTSLTEEKDMAIMT